MLSDCVDVAITDWRLLWPEQTVGNWRELRCVVDYSSVGRASDCRHLAVIRRRPSKLVFKLRQLDDNTKAHIRKLAWFVKAVMSNVVVDHNGDAFGVIHLLRVHYGPHALDEHIVFDLLPPCVMWTHGEESNVVALVWCTTHYPDDLLMWPSPHRPGPGCRLM